jgi:hypothetical protein
MSYNKCKVVMLPAEDISMIAEWNNKLEYYEKGADPHIVNNQHLYILSSGEIKEGDWVIYKHPMHDNLLVTKIVNANYSSNCKAYAVKHTEGYGIIEGYSKIIATTDRLNDRPKLHNGSILTSEILPKLPESFIREYIEAYNKGNVITDVDVEYEEYCAHGDNCPSKGAYDKQYLCNIKIKTKTSNDNTIIIKKIKNSWSREEVEVLCRKAISEHCGLSISNQTYNPKESFEMATNWITKNL